MSEGQSEANAELIQYLANNDVRCPKCNYMLRGTKSKFCPGCYGKLQLGLIWNKSTKGWWASSLYGALFATLLGLSSLASSVCSAPVRNAVVYANYQQMVSEWATAPPPIIAFFVATICTVGSGAFAAYIAVSRRRYVCWLPRTRWIMTSIAISSPIFVALAVYLVYRFG